MSLLRREAVVFVVLMMVCVACSPPNRPANVSALAVWAESAKTGYWKSCAADQAGIHCTIWNQTGSVLKDERFLPLDGGRLPSAEELHVKSAGNGGPYDIRLDNGRLLVPESMFSKYKERYNSPAPSGGEDRR